MTPHKHADLIKAWADGAKIEYWDTLKNTWAQPCGGTPMWNVNNTYRIKPEPKPDITVTRTIDLSHVPSGDLANGMIAVGCWGRDNVKFVFDGETHKLKSVELL